MITFVPYFFCMARFLYISFLVMLAAVECEAQFSAVVLDMETRRQVAGVAVYINPKGVVRTDMRGRFVIDGAFNSVTLVRQGYESLTLERSEMTDSIWMLPNGRSLDEVVIIGHRPKLGFSTKDKNFDKYNLPRNNSLIGGFDFFESLNFKKQKQKKRREKIKKILDKY